MGFYKISHVNGMFFPFYVEADNHTHALDKAKDVVHFSERSASGRYSYGNSKYNTDINNSIRTECVDELGGTPNTVMHAGEIWKSRGVEYVVMVNKSTYSISPLVVKCPTNANIDLEPDRFFVKHPYAVKVHP